MSELQHIVGRGGGSDGGSLLTQLAKFRFGRVLLWFGAAFFALASAGAGENGSVVLFIAFILAFVALIGHFVAARRKRVARASMRNTLTLLGLVLVFAVGALWLVFRRKKTVAERPPTQSEVDALIREAEA